MKPITTKPRITKNGNLLFPAKPQTETVQPWIGEIFGIPAPSYIPEPEIPLKRYAFEIEILLKDFTTLKYRIEGTDRLENGHSKQDLVLRQLAYDNENAIAFITKGFVYDENGQPQKSIAGNGASFRKDSCTWKWHPGPEQYGKVFSKEDWEWFDKHDIFPTYTAYSNYSKRGDYYA